MRWFKSAALFLAAGSAITFFTTCEKVSPFQGEAQSEDQIAIEVRDTLFDTLKVSGDTLLGVRAYKLRFSDPRAAWSAAGGEPRFLEIFKYYPAVEQSNLVGRISVGGGGLQAGDTVFYVSDGAVDTIPFSGLLEAVILKSSQDKQKFNFGARILYGPALLGPRTFTGGFRNNLVISSQLLGGGNTRSISINNYALNTADNVVTLRARIDTTGTDTLFYYRFSSIGFLRFDLVFAMDSAFTANSAAAPDIPFMDGLELHSADSTVVDFAKAPIGKFGGKFPIPVLRLSDYFDSVGSAGEPGWVDVVKRDTLVSGPGKKWVFLNGRKWRSPMYEDIDIAPYSGEVVPDLKRGEWRMNSIEGKACLVSDDIPFQFNTFGDTTFEDSVWVWLATRNLSNVFLDNGQFTRLKVESKENDFEAGPPWPDAVLETPPEKFTLGVLGVPNGQLTPDYESGYRVSPFFLQYLAISQLRSMKYDDNNVYGSGLYRSNSPLLNRMVKKGSILGYDEAQLNHFKEADSIFIEVKGSLKKVGAPGWFEYVPLSIVAPDSTFTPQHLIDYFSPSNPGMTNSDGSLYLEKGDGLNFYSIYSAYVYSESNSSFFRFQPELFYFNGGGAALFRNPFRSIPYFISRNAQGSKEFALIAYTRGKFFKEPRVFISSFSSTFKTVWDKIPPHINWATSTDPSDQVYAPMYYVNSFNPLVRTVSDLSAILVPNVFDVSLSSASPVLTKECSVRDVGFGRISSVKLGFNYAPDFLGLDPVTGLRTYKTGNIYVELDEQKKSQQGYFQYGPTQVSNALEKVSFKGVDARLWRTGIWDMWIETADDLGNTGVAPINGTSYALPQGIISLRQIQIK